MRVTTPGTLATSVLTFLLFHLILDSLSTLKLYSGQVATAVTNFKKGVQTKSLTIVFYKCTL